MAAEREIEVVGIHAVEEAAEPCHLVEMIVFGDEFNVDDITQARVGEPRDDWQVPWDAKVLDDFGERIVASAWDLPEPGELPAGRTRLVFFLHHLDPSVPLTTPWGDIELLPPTPRPERLAIVEYEEP